jgi:hypothetical protein
MRATGFLLVAALFVAVALLAYAIIHAAGWEAHDFALVAAALVASQVGALIWRRQAPGSAERSVKLGLGAVLSVTAVAFTLIFQAVSGWLAYPEVTVPIAAIGCFVFPFAVVGPVWKVLSKGQPPESTNAEPGTAPGRRGV